MVTVSMESCQDSFSVCDHWYPCTVLESGGAFINRISSRVYFVPLSLSNLIDINIVFLLSHILNAPKHEDIVLISYEGMASSWLHSQIFTSGVSLFSTLSHAPALMSKLHRSFRVFSPFVPPKIYSLLSKAAIEEQERPSGSHPLGFDLYTTSHFYVSKSNAKMSFIF